jgi:ppGpp synthetase/RelA/SpoT-type nucleotidyltranferase
MNDEERQWHRARCAEYKAEFPVYQAYATVLEQILKVACRAQAPMAIVQSRPKAFSSFAEKMARKAKRYRSLGIGPTDLCGARVITETQAEVDRISALIRDNFEIDEKNSVDVRTRLKTEEFGYRSVHYVVQLKGLEIFGVRIPPEIGDRKAEIQVRTLLQHAHASVSHDRIYKTSLKVQENLKRDLARVAALLEEGDQEFGKCVRELDSYKLHYGAYMNKTRLAEETDVLEMVLESEPDPAQRPVVALRLAQLARATGDYARIAELLAPFVDSAGKPETEALTEHGNALCRVHAEEPRSKEFQKGCTELDSALENASGNLRTRALGYRAWVQSQIPNNETKARDSYRAALDADPSNPFHLASFVEYEIFLGEKLGLRSALAPSFKQAISRCRDDIDAGIEVPWSFFTIGRLQLLLDQPFESLAAYAKAVQICIEKESPVPVSALEAEITFVQRINRGQQLRESHAWILQLLLLGQAVWTGQPSTDLSARRASFAKPVVIVAGGTGRAFQANVDRFRQVVVDAFHGFGGTIISGGTNAGVAGLAGEIALAERAKKGGPLEVLGYIPRNLPYDQPADVRYTELVPSEGPGVRFHHNGPNEKYGRTVEGFVTYGPVHALQYWTDLVLAGVKPQDVRTLGIDGGPISAFEYRLALALGASVGLMEPSTRAAADLLADPDWRECGGLIGLPDDTRSVQAFLQPPRPALTGEQLEVAAQKIHAAYLEEKHYQNPDPAMKPWDKLFMGAAMSITAFPVLARILAERGLLRSRMGTLAIACAAVDDVTGWCILAYIVVLVRVAHAARPAWMTIAGSVLYVLIMLFVVRRILPAFEREFRKRDRLSDNLLAVIVVLVLASALATEWLGIHLLFGAFLMGAIMPKAPEFTRYLLHKFESVTVVLLLPLFFAFTGLRTRIGVGGGRAIWFYLNPAHLGLPSTLRTPC